MSTPRRRFLGWLGSASLLGAVGRPAFAESPSMRRPDADEAHPAAISDTWDMSWTARATGRHKAVFDSPEMSGGAALYRAVAWCEQYKEVYGVERSDLTTVIVLRHQGFLFAMNDTFWERFEIGKERKVRTDQGKKWQTVNPVGPAAAAASPDNAKYALTSFIADGGIALACGWTFQGAVNRFQKADGLSPADARARAKEHLIPGVILQPNGIFAALRAQEAGCSYINAS